MAFLNVSLFNKILSTVALASIVGLTGCSESDTAEQSAEQSTIRIATEGAYPPFNYTKNDGTLAGFDVEVAKALCSEMQIECQIEAQDWDGIIPGLLAKKYDAIIAGMSITPERAEKVDFTEPYFTNTMVWLAKNDDSFDPNSISDKNLGGQRATTLGAYLQDNYEGKDGNTVKLYDTYENAYLDLKSGRIDAVLAEKVSAADWLPENPEYAVIGDEINNNDNIAIALRKDDPLKQKFDDAIATIRENGELAKLEESNFGQ